MTMFYPGAFRQQGLRHALRYSLLICLLGPLLLTLLAVANWLFPLRQHVLQPSFAPMYYDRHGQLLGARLSADEKWRFAGRLEDVSPYLVTALLEFEDKRFYQHWGIDIFAVLRATWRNITAGRVVSGSSTITMQVARLLHPQRQYRTLRGKLVQMLRALQLEWHLSKQEILALYFTLAPYGKNIEGVTAASWIYFHKSPATLHWTEAIALAITPKSPNAYRPDRFPLAAQQHCQRLAERLRHHGHISDADWWFVDCSQAPGALHPLPRYASHLLDRLHTGAGRQSSLVRQEATDSRHQPHVRTTLDLDVQLAVEQTITGYLRELPGHGIQHAAALIIDNASGEVLAYVGSPNFTDSLHAGQVDGVRAHRSPGSTLKPLLYARALESGHYTPQTLLANVPLRYKGYHPRNITAGAWGMVHLDEALQQSLNLPAVALNVGLGPQHDLLALLREAGVSTLPHSGAHYGQSLVLGGGDMRLDELTTLYAALARGGLLLPTRLLVDAAPLLPLPRPWLTPEASFMITDILRQTPVPGYAASARFFKDMPEVAWKTGTSSRQRDAWAIGYNPRYTVGVWVGHFSGAPLEHLTGQAIAAPLFFRLFRLLPGAQTTPWPSAPARLIAQRVCRLSGRLPAAHCPTHTRTGWIAGVTRPELCPMHVQLLLDTVSGRRLSDPCIRSHDIPPWRIRRQPGILWPREVGGWLARLDSTVLFPAFAAGCAPESLMQGPPPLLHTPLDGEHYVLHRGSSRRLGRWDALVFSASVSNDVQRLDWFLDGKKLAATRPGETYGWPPQPGRHELVLVDNFGRTTQARFTVQAPAP